MKGRTHDRSYNHQHYLQEYDARTPVEQELLQALAVLHIPCHVDDIVEYLALIPASRCAKLSRDFVESRLRELENVHLVVSQNHEIYQLKFELTQELFSKLVWTQKLEGFVNAARTHFPLLDQACELNHTDVFKAELFETGSEVILFAIRVALYLNNKEFDITEYLSLIHI